jgi:hypothetical protein
MNDIADTIVWNMNITAKNMGLCCRLFSMFDVYTSLAHVASMLEKYAPHKRCEHD